MTDLTIVTGIWDLGREQAGTGFQRSFEQYRTRFAQLLAADVPMVVFGDAAMREFVLEHRGHRPTDFRERPASHFRSGFDFFSRVQTIRRDPAWLAQAAWLPESPQASLELYNPMVMSKMFMLNDATIWNPFDSTHLAWIDGGITHTVHPGYFTHDRVFSKVSQLLDRFFFVSFPYVGGEEVHGFARSAMRAYCGEDSTFVCRGGFFGGHKDCIGEANSHYYQVLSASLHEGRMGTEESIFTIMAYEEPTLYDRYELLDEHHGMLAHFFEHVKSLPEGARRTDDTTPAPRPHRPRRAPDISDKTVAGYVVTFNAPDQLRAMLESWRAGFRFDQLFILDNSTDAAARAANRAIAETFHAQLLTHSKGNGGICGGRQLIAEHFDGTTFDYCVFLEDDMFLNASDMAGVCRNGFRLSLPDLRTTALKIMAIEGYDFLKFSFTEFYGDNRTQFSWYNVPQQVRQRFWPNKSRLPKRGLDPDAPSTHFERIGAVDGVAYADGDVYYCNWPQIVSRPGNRRMFLETTWEYPYEQTWMSHMFQMTVRGELRPAVLLASVITHDRTTHYPAEERREN